MPSQIPVRRNCADRSNGQSRKAFAHCPKATKTVSARYYLQGEAQRAAQAAQILPLERCLQMSDGRTFTECFRTQSPGHGGCIVYQESSPPGIVLDSYNYHCIEIDIDNGRETLGRTIETSFSLDAAITAANRHIDQ
jgi:hypothetical protein